MGMFDAVSSTVTKAEGLADKTKGPLDTANQLLGGGTEAAAGADGTTPADIPYKHGRDIDEDVKEAADAYSHNLENALNASFHLEFIHFDYVHISMMDYFPHADYSDMKNNAEVETGARPRAIQFRSGLEREAVLLSEFMKATQRALVERESTGSVNLASVVNTLGNLFGSNTAPTKTKATELDSHIGNVVAAVKPVLVDAILYKNTHQAGMDLHEARIKYRTLLTKIAEEKPDPDPTGGLMSKIPGLGSVAGPLAKIVSFTQGVSTKAQDVKAKFFALAALQMEAQIELACNEVTLKAIAELANPFLPVWYRNRDKKEEYEKWQNAPANPLSTEGNVGDLLGSGAVRKVGGVRDDIVDEGNKVKKFFEKPADDPPPGQDALGTAFKNPPEPDTKKGQVPMEMGRVAVQAFVKALGMTPPLGVPETVISGIVGVVLEFTSGVYQALLVRDATQAITQEAMLQSAREDIQIVQRLEGIALANLQFVKDAKKWETPDIPYAGDFHVRPADLVEKEGDKLDQLIADKLQPVLDPILTYAMGSLAEELEKARLAGVANNCDTMEWYLGRLPSVQVGLFCHLFFPFWNALMQVVAGLLDNATGGILKSIVGAASSAQQEVAKVQAIAAAGHQAAEDAKAKMAAVDDAVTKTQRELGQSTQVQDIPGKLGAAGSRFNDAMGAKGAKPADPASAAAAKAAAGPASLNPVADRSEKGQADKIKPDEYKEVKGKHQWLGSDDTKKEDAPATDSPAPASAAA